MKQEYEDSLAAHWIDNAWATAMVDYYRPLAALEAEKEGLHPEEWYKSANGYLRYKGNREFESRSLDYQPDRLFRDPVTLKWLERMTAALALAARSAFLIEIYQSQEGDQCES